MLVESNFITHIPNDPIDGRNNKQVKFRSKWEEIMKPGHSLPKGDCHPVCTHHNTQNAPQTTWKSDNKRTSDCWSQLDCKSKKRGDFGQFFSYSL
jgi:hypothetical protein